MLSIAGGRPLTEDSTLGSIFCRWLQGNGLVGSAEADLEGILGGPASGGAGSRAPGRVWQNREWLDRWWAEILPDLPDDRARQRAEQDLADLAAGRAEVVITGQQPGFLGGPLYTLYKAATCVVVAEARTAAGRPTVPVFWLADDDDDRREAFAPLLFDPRRGALLHGVAPPGPADRMVGAAPAAELGAGALAWLAERRQDGPLASDLHHLWQEAVETGLSWGRLQRRALLRFFRDCGLLVVSGDDPGLHAAAADLYGQLWQDRTEVLRLGDRRGQELVAAGLNAQISRRSLERFLNRAEADRRLALGASPESTLPPAAELRPGVAVRSLVQDWLFGPAAVVVGPAELAYLKQLEPLYERFGVCRSGLVPRLFARLVPEGQVDLANGRSARGEDPGAEAVAAGAREIASQARRALATALREVVGLDSRRAANLADQQAERWGRAAAKLLAGEMKRARERPRPAEPPWLRPAGKRQERVLASYWAATRWGDSLAGAILEAARQHCQEGRNGNWNEFLLSVPDDTRVSRVNEGGAK